MHLFDEGTSNRRDLPKMLLVRDDLSNEPRWQAPDFGSLSADKPISAWSWSGSPSVVVAMMGGSTVSGTSSPVVQSVLPTLRTLDAVTGTQLEERTLGTTGTPYELWVSRPSPSGAFVATNLNGFTPISADGRIGTYRYLASSDELTHAYAGFLGERTVYVQYAPSGAKLHLVASDARQETPAGGVSLQSFTLPADSDGKQPRLIDAIADSENRLLLMFGADSPTVGWRVVRYWL